MKRRSSRDAMTADELVALHARAESAALGLTPAGKARAVSAFLGEHCADPVTIVQARYWIRRGRPADYGPARENGWV